MLMFSHPVKYLGMETKTGTSQKTGNPYEVTEAKIFIPDLGRIRVPINGSPKLPAVDSMIQLSLSVDQGNFQSLRVVWDESSLHKSA